MRAQRLRKHGGKDPEFGIDGKPERRTEMKEEEETDGRRLGDARSEQIEYFDNAGFELLASNKLAKGRAC